jgi:hypothetical protein
LKGFVGSGSVVALVFVFVETDIVYSSEFLVAFSIVIDDICSSVVTVFSISLVVVKMPFQLMFR